MKYTVIAFQAALIVLIALLVLAVALHLAGLLVLSDPSATLIGGLFGAAAVGLAAVVGFNAQAHAAKLNREAAEAARKEEARGLAGMLASELHVCDLRHSKHIESLIRTAERAQPFSHRYYPRIECPVFEANVGRLYLLPRLLQINAVMAYSLIRSGDYIDRVITDAETARSLVRKLEKDNRAIRLAKKRISEFALDGDTSDTLKNWFRRDIYVAQDPASPAPAAEPVD